ncbi:hypothetical protein [Microvirga lotononidis]|uniref:Uncharacterized protein n=1 Tax=Microvirga lotononidis TaxID=864069 RepID=I4Z2D0_9HYPH|nr:hypothetical protein [Microvirga lotononidis]EIM30372.1 hypothetical protein MicloDRAFT_00009220 [Microvirga lotononidis]WQO30870.1 hypothetical protein U0023_26015 [Microvirga lotononidis]
MSKLPALPSLARKALTLLQESREFRYALETSSYTRREQFKARLKTASGRMVRGIGISTMYELKGHGLIVPANSTSVSTYYRLNPNHVGEINDCASQG